MAHGLIHELIHELLKKRKQKKVERSVGKKMGRNGAGHTIEPPQSDKKKENIILLGQALQKS